MEGVVAVALAFIVPEKCVAKYLQDYDFFNVACFKILLSKVLGYGIIVGSTLVKLPQILKIVKTGSARGLSIPSGLLELICYVASSSYAIYHKFPFSSYGDSTFLLVQSAIICFLTISWEVSYQRSFIFLSVLIAFVAYTVSPGVNVTFLAVLQAMNTPIILFSRGLQIYANYKNGSTGQLSAISVWLMTAGALARIFTSVQETGDILLIANFVISSLVNIILSGQIIYYWNVDTVSDVKSRKVNESIKNQ